MAFINRMAGHDYIDKTREYLDYLEEHLNNVAKAFEELSKACEGMQWVGDDYCWHMLRQEVICHDLSKFSSFEFTQYRASFFPINDIDKENSAFQAAWKHHKDNNNHHHESIYGYTDIVHMVIDWMAMGYKFNDTPKEYYDKNKDRIVISDDNKQFMFELFEKLHNYRERSQA